MSTPPRTLQMAGMTIQVFPDAESAAMRAAEQAASAIREAVQARGKAVLGLPTGGTPIPIYAQLVAFHRTGNLSFANVSTYNLDEYYPISPCDRNSYRHYMQRNLFDDIDIAPNRTHILDGTVPEGCVSEHTAAYERWIEADGGIDLQLLGIGRNGHVGFNEPCDRPVEELLQSRTRLVDLHPVTLADAVGAFGGEAKVIRRALTMGVATVLAARSILVVALGENKAEAVGLALTDPMKGRIPASLLQSAPQKVSWILDEPAATELR